MECIINDELMPMVNNGKLSRSKILDLISIKEFIERVSTKRYFDKESLDKITRKNGVLPSVVTWGDYFQTELAFDLVDRTDEGFRTAIETVRFDIISSRIIFSGKDICFFEWVDINYYTKIAEKESTLTEELEEAFHLIILKEYFVFLGISDRFTEDEMKWYNSYKERAAV